MKKGLILMLMFSLLGHIAAAGMLYVAGAYDVWNEQPRNGIDDQTGDVVKVLWVFEEENQIPLRGTKEHENVIPAQAGIHVGEGLKPSPTQTAFMSQDLVKVHEDVTPDEAGNPGRGGFETLPYTESRDLDNDLLGNGEHEEEFSDKSGGDCISATACTASNVSTSSVYANTGQVVKNGEGDSGAGLKTFLEALRSEIERHKNYPPFAQNNGIEGTAYLNFHIGDNGRPDGIIIEKSSGSKILDESAIRTLKGMERFYPVPEEIRDLGITVPIAYRLVEDTDKKNR